MLDGSNNKLQNPYQLTSNTSVSSTAYYAAEAIQVLVLNESQTAQLFGHSIFTSTGGSLASLSELLEPNEHNTYDYSALSQLSTYDATATEIGIRYEQARLDFRRSYVFFDEKTGHKIPVSTLEKPLSLDELNAFFGGSAAMTTHSIMTCQQRAHVFTAYSNGHHLITESLGIPPNLPTEKYANKHIVSTRNPTFIQHADGTSTFIDTRDTLSRAVTRDGKTDEPLPIRYTVEVKRADLGNNKVQECNITFSLELFDDNGIDAIAMSVARKVKEKPELAVLQNFKPAKFAMDAHLQAITLKKLELALTLAPNLLNKLKKEHYLVEDANAEQAALFLLHIISGKYIVSNQKLNEIINTVHELIAAIPKDKPTADQKEARALLQESTAILSLHRNYAIGKKGTPSLSTAEYLKKLSKLQRRQLTRISILDRLLYKISPQFFKRNSVKSSLFEAQGRFYLARQRIQRNYIQRKQEKLNTLILNTNGKDVREQMKLGSTALKLFKEGTQKTPDDKAKKRAFALIARSAYERIQELTASAASSEVTPSDSLETEVDSLRLKVRKLKALAKAIQAKLEIEYRIDHSVADTLKYYAKVAQQQNISLSVYLKNYESGLKAQYKAIDSILKFFNNQSQVDLKLKIDLAFPVNISAETKKELQLENIDRLLTLGVTSLNTQLKTSSVAYQKELNNVLTPILGNRVDALRTIACDFLNYYLHQPSGELNVIFNKFLTTQQPDISAIPNEQISEIVYKLFRIEQSPKSLSLLRSHLFEKIFIEKRLAFFNKTTDDDAVFSLDVETRNLLAKLDPSRLENMESSLLYAGKQHASRVSNTIINELGKLTKAKHYQVEKQQYNTSLNNAFPDLETEEEHVDRLASSNNTNTPLVALLTSKPEKVSAAGLQSLARYQAATKNLLLTTKLGLKAKSAALNRQRMETTTKSHSRAHVPTNHAKFKTSYSDALAIAKFSRMLRPTKQEVKAGTLPVMRAGHVLPSAISAPFRKPTKV